MKKVLSMVVLTMILAVSVLAATSNVTVPVYLNVPEFVRITIDDIDGEFNLVFDPADPESTVEDTVALLAEANVYYNVTSEVEAVTDYTDWVNLIQVTIDNTVSGFGAPGKVTFNTTAKITGEDIIENLHLGTLSNTKIADVVFTISSL